MKKIVLITLPVLFSIVISCSQKPKQTDAPAGNIPMVLEGKRVDVSSLYKRNKENLFESVYQELISKSQELQNLDATIKSLGKLQQQSLDSFRTFNDKNQAYYESARLNVNNIKDSAFRIRVLALVNESFKQYENKTLSYLQLDSLLTRKTAALNDLYILLKVTKTLPAMHNFQQERMPGIFNPELLSKQMDSLSIILDSLSRQP